MSLGTQNSGNQGGLSLLLFYSPLLPSPLVVGMQAESREEGPLEDMRPSLPKLGSLPCACIVTIYLTSASWNNGSCKMLLFPINGITASWCPVKSNGISLRLLSLRPCSTLWSYLELPFLSVLLKSEDWAQIPLFSAA